jgi:hypothetical protein
VAFLPPHPTTHIEARVGEAVIFFLEWTPSVGQHKPTEVVKVSSTAMKNVLILSKNFRRPDESYPKINKKTNFRRFWVNFRPHLTDGSFLVV